MSINRPVPFAELQELCMPGQKPRRATVEKWAHSVGIRYNYDGRGGIWTTLAALEASMGLNAANDAAPYDPAELFGRDNGGARQEEET